ncbi:MAG: PQQ-binding-like beta-propeller repeat protein, partial [Pyrinomonadaceae bacterium]
LSKQTGITNWTLKLPDAENHFLVGFKDSIVVVSKSGVIQSIKSESGVVNWKRQIAESFAAKPAITGVKLHVAATGRQVFTISMETGEIESLRRVPFNVTSLGGVQTGELIVGDERGNLSSLSNAGDKANWKFKSGGEVSQIFPVGEHLLVTSHDNFIYFLGRGNGGLVWKKRLTGRVSQIANLMDRFALISSVEDHTAVFIDLANGKVAGQIAFGDDERFLYSPVSSSNLIFVLTDEAAYAFSLAGCSQNKESGPDTKPATAILK